MTAYSVDHSAIEKKWQDIWSLKNVFVAEIDSTRPKKYILEMLPYPSGRIHMGHLRNYAIGDVIARYERANGFNVIHPMGWDAFGLPAENAAIQNNIAPSVWTIENIKSMRRQLEPIGFSYDWSREITTCSPNYYKHEQKIFIDFYNAGLAYQKESVVNWDPIDNTVLANEQVVDGKGWRSGATVERKKLRQWFLKITDFADELLSGLDTLTGWPEKVRLMQEKWIGKSEGAEVIFKILDSEIVIYTTRPDTLFGAAFIGVAYDHAIVSRLESSTALTAFIQTCKSMSTSEDAVETAEKLGFDTGLKAKHPLDSSILIPVYIANFVLSDYGTGAVFGCPAHDKRDHEFAIRYNLPIKQVVKPIHDVMIDCEKEPFTENGVAINSQFLNGLETHDAKKICIEYLERNGFGSGKVTYRLRDWGVSRQRYWGAPIPMIHCDSCGTLPVPESSLPVELPLDISFDKPGNPLSNHPTWKHVACPKCGGAALRETDTFDTFFESSWYFLRYCSPKSDKPFNYDDVKYWGPVDQYIGGVEHAVMHLLYARFFTKALKKLNYLEMDEPFTNLLTQGMINHETYKDINGNWLYPEEITKKTNGEYCHISTGEPVHIGRIEKMSKSKKNVVEPDTMLQKYGADTVRLFVLSDSPPERDLEWTEAGVEGCYKYLMRVEKLVDDALNSVGADEDGDNLKITKLMHTTIYNVTSDLKNFHFNKAIARMREFTNAIVASSISKAVKIDALKMLIRLLNPVVPHITEELWEKIGMRDDLLVLKEWPSCDETMLGSDVVTIAVQTNGKLRATLEVSKDAAQHEVEGVAMSLTTVQHFLNDKNIKKVIYIPNKIINIVYT